MTTQTITKRIRQGLVSLAVGLLVAVPLSGCAIIEALNPGQQAPDEPIETVETDPTLPSEQLTFVKLWQVTEIGENNVEHKTEIMYFIFLEDGLFDSWHGDTHIGPGQWVADDDTVVFTLNGDSLVCDYTMTPERLSISDCLGYPMVMVPAHD
ncbi:MAG: hypothetical protein FWG08_00455 [Propionibacteriaceae bacterium]|nr:hypothetical protein [Propionibacteriaceae bacterium]